MSVSRQTVTIIFFFFSLFINIPLIFYSSGVISCSLITFLSSLDEKNNSVKCKIMRFNTSVIWRKKRLCKPPVVIRCGIQWWNAEPFPTYWFGCGRFHNSTWFSFCTTTTTTPCPPMHTKIYTQSILNQPYSIISSMLFLGLWSRSPSFVSEILIYFFFLRHSSNNLQCFCLVVHHFFQKQTQ